MEYPIISSQLRNKDYTITDKAKKFGFFVKEDIDKLFNDGIEKGFSAQDVNTIISYLLFWKYSEYLYDKDIEFL